MVDRHRSEPPIKIANCQWAELREYKPPPFVDGFSSVQASQVRREAARLKGGLLKAKLGFICLRKKANRPFLLLNFAGGGRTEKTVAVDSRDCSGKDRRCKFHAFL